MASAAVNTDEARSNISAGRVQAARILSSAVGSALTAMIVHPLEVVKVNLQKSDSGESSKKLHWSRPRLAIPCPHGTGTILVPCTTTKSAASIRRNMVSMISVNAPRLTTTPNNTNPTGTMEVVREILKSEGYSGLYRGLRPTLVMGSANAVVYYTLYDGFADAVRLAQKQQPQENQSSLAVPLVAGGASRLVSSSLIAPLEYLRTVQAARNKTSQKSTLQQLVKLSQKGGGVQSLYRGLGAALARDVPFSAIYWLVIEQMRELQKEHEASPSAVRLPQFAHDFSHGVLGGMVGVVLTGPADTVKTRLQTSSLNKKHKMAAAFGGGKSCKSNPSAWSVYQEILAKEGVVGLFKGSVPRMLKVAPGCGIMITSYEFGKRLLLPEQFSG